MTVQAGGGECPPARPNDVSRRTLWQRLWRYRYAALFVGPTMVLIFIFAVLPILLAFVTSFTDLDLGGLRDWSRIEVVGLANYIQLVDDPRFLASLANTLFFVILGVPAIIVVSLGAALMVNYGTSWLFSGVRALFFLPAITNIVAVAFVWAFIYNTDAGLLNLLLSTTGADPVPWLQQPWLARLAVVVVAVWQGMGLNMLIFLSALQGIPPEFYEAAEIDGANTLQRFFHITIPQLSFATFFVVVTATIAWIQLFATPLVLTEGGPLDSTLSVALFIYQNGFELNRFGYGSAASFLLFLVVVLVTLIQFRLRRRDGSVR